MALGIVFPPSLALTAASVLALISVSILGVLEIRGIHKYSGDMALDSTIIISVSYFFLSLSLIYTHILNQQLPEPSIDLKYPGIVLFLIGIGSNFYHHCLLSKLRAEGGRDYKIPKGGLFGLVICPHYLFEILGLMGIRLF
ncbi:hypothetical protein V6N11_070364 [Hibiscus sabdariffa]|uniref:3-oxo-5-alpha-steroid 4-dehydrogenase C-terminal domain-containing protein n=2 Tax=Hibiscus sabdariffa TaxID=183260 RepID=A0ABR1Z650_9ROSI